jgi:ribosomal protein L35
VRRKGCYFDAEDEDPQRRQEAFPRDRLGQDHARAGQQKHRLEVKTSKRSRKLSNDQVVAKSDEKRIKRLLGLR